MRRSVEVVGAVILASRAILCAQRGPDAKLAGLWEFPGGKVEDGESPTAALAREIQEELSCSIEVGRQITTTTHDYDFARIRLTTYYCELVGGTPVPHEHAELRWVAPQELMTLKWAPADIPAVLHIQEELA